MSPEGGRAVNGAEASRDIDTESEIKKIKTEEIYYIHETKFKNRQIEMTILSIMGID